jgi:hypothetical protein
MKGYFMDIKLPSSGEKIKVTIDPTHKPIFWDFVKDIFKNQLRNREHLTESNISAMVETSIMCAACFAKTNEDVFKPKAVKPKDGEIAEYNSEKFDEEFRDDNELVQGPESFDISVDD